MPRGRATFRFQGANQEIGSRHIQIGELVTARNVRQLKGGEYRKRRGFSRVDPLETLIIDNVTHRRGGDVLSLSQLTVDATAVAATTERILGAPYGLAGTNLAIPMDWPGMGVGRVKVGVTGVLTVATNGATIRIRVGGAPLDGTTAAGTVVATLVLGTGADQVIDLVSAEINAPTAISYLQVTVESTAGTTTVTPVGMSAWVQPIGGEQMMLLANGATWTDSLGEIVRAQWLVDFDQFHSSYSSVEFNLVGRTFQAVSGQGDYRVRVGGTHGSIDGTEVLLNHRTGDSANDGRLSEGSGTIAKPSGVQLVKGTLSHVTGGLSCEMRGASILIKGVA